MSSSRRIRQRREQRSCRRHQLRLEGLEKRYALNAAPVLDPSASPQLNSVIEDASIPVGQVGTLVADLIDSGGRLDNYADPEDDPPGIAITSLDLRGGTLWYSKTGGQDWATLDDAQKNAAPIFRADSLTRLYYQPLESASDEHIPLLRFKAIDFPSAATTGQTIVNTASTASLALGTIQNLLYTARDVVISDNDNIAYIAFQEGKLGVVQMATAPSSSSISYLDIPTGFIEGVTVSPDRTVLAASDETGFVHLFDIRNPASPVLAAAVAVAGRPEATVFSQDSTTLFVAAWTGGMQVLDVSNPSNPVLLGAAETTGNCLGISLSADEQTVYAASAAAGINVIDVSNKSSPVRVAQIYTPNWARSTVLSSDQQTLYVADGTSGLQIIDVSTPLSPQVISTAETGGMARQIVLSSDEKTAFIAAGEAGLQIVDITDKIDPTVIGTADGLDWDIGWVNGLALSSDNSRVFLADNVRGLVTVQALLSAPPPYVSLLSDEASIEVFAVNDPPTLDPINDVFILEDDPEQFII